MGDGCFLIVSGSVAVLWKNDKLEKQVAILESGALFGETALLTNSPRNATIQALEDVQLLKLNKEELRHIMGKDPRIARTLLELLHLRDHPCQKKGITCQNITSEGTVTTILKDSEKGTYYRLSPEGLFLWQLLDGTNNLKDLVLLYFQKFHQFAPHAVAEMVAGLVSAGFALGNMSRVDQTLIKKSFLSQCIKKISALLQWKMMIENVDPFIKRAYYYFRWFFTRPVQVFLIFLNAAGLVAFCLEWSRIHPLLVPPAWTPHFFLLIPFVFLSIFIHEMGHALTVKSFGRDVLSVGVGWHWISPIFYVDTSDMWLEKRWPRIAVSLAGPYAQLVFVHLVALVGFFISSDDFVSVWWIFSAGNYLIILFNLNPLFKYDGYYILQDLRASH